jgi:hypothetical protein
MWSWIKSFFKWMGGIVADVVMWVLNPVINIFKSIVKSITDMIDGIAIMIENFRRIVCFLGSIPKRIHNINYGMYNTFKGVNKEFEAVGKSFMEGTASIGNLGAYIAEFVRTYIFCFGKFTTNIFYCIFFYIIDLFIYLIWLCFVWFPIAIIEWITNIDFSYIPQNVYKGLIPINDFIFSTFGFHILYWPKSVREDCYVCKTLKNSAVTKAADNVEYTFNTKIPKNFGESRAIFKKAQRHFDEAVKTWVRTPDKVP